MKSNTIVQYLLPVCLGALLLWGCGSTVEPEMHSASGTVSVTIPEVSSAEFPEQEASMEVSGTGESEEKELQEVFPESSSSQAEPVVPEEPESGEAPELEEPQEPPVEVSSAVPDEPVTVLEPAEETVVPLPDAEPDPADVKPLAEEEISNVPESVEIQSPEQDAENPFAGGSVPEITVVSPEETEEESHPGPGEGIHF